MTSVVDLYNRALAACGARSRVASPTEVSEEARNCNLLYPGIRDAALEMAPWDFAKVYTTLALIKAKPGTPENPSGASGLWVATSPPPPWLYEYAYPSDCVRMRWVLPQAIGLPDPGPPMRYARASDLISGAQTAVILTSAPSAIGVYTLRIEDPNAWPPLFTEAVVSALAARLSIPLSGDKTLATGNLNAANAIIGQARVTDGNESFQQIDRLPDWIIARDSLPFPYEPPDPLVFVSLFSMS